MKSIFATLKAQLKASSDIIGLIVGMLTMIAGISNLFASIFSSRFTSALLCIGAIFILRIVTAHIINAKKTVLQIESPIYTKTQRNVANIVSKAAFLLLVFPVYAEIAEYIGKSNDRKSNNAQFGVIITSFSKSDDDDFSYRLFNTLNDNLQNIDSVNTIKESVFINAGNKGYLDTIRQTFAKNYFNHGLLVFGKRSQESKLFDCSIYVGNQDKVNIIYLKNPDMINFSIDYQSEIVSEFILGLLYYDIGDYARSKEKFQNALNINDSKESKKFKAYCHFYIGNNLLNEKNSSFSIAHYEEGISYDPMNPFIHYNLARALLNKGDSLIAFKHFNIANELNSALDNPIKDLDLSKNKKVMIEPNISKLHKEMSNDQLTDSNNVKETTVVVNKKDNMDFSYSVIVINKKYGVINSNGDTVIKCKYDFIDEYAVRYREKRLFIVNTASKFGAVNSEGLFEIALKYATKEEVYDAISELAIKKKPVVISQF